MIDEMDLRYIKPFTHNGKQIPALHDLKRNAHKLSWLGFFKPDKFRFNLINYSDWVKTFKAINNNRPKSRAWAYLIQGTSGVFAQGTKKLSFQPCIFATWEEAQNMVQVIRTFTYQGKDWVEIKTLNVHDTPPNFYELDLLLAHGFAHRYVVIGKKGRLSRAPKDNGNVFIFIVSDGTRMYIEADKLIKVT